MLRIILHIALVLLALSSFAQSNKCFKAYNSSGVEITTFCVNQEVTFQDCGNVVPDDKEYYVFDYKSGTQIPSNPSLNKKHTYTTPGKYRVLQIANYGGATLTDTVSRVFEVKAAPAPTFTVTACANNSVQINITDNNYDSYSIDYGGGGAPVQAQKGQNPIYTYVTNGTYTITLIGTYTGASCNGSAFKQVTTLPDAKTPTLRALTVKQQSTSGEIQFDIQDLQPGFMYIIERWQDPRINFQKIDTIKNITQNSITHTIRNVNTTEGVWYLVRIADQCGSVIPNSNSRIISSIALEAKSGNEQAILTWKSMPSADQYEIYRNNTLITTVDNSTLTYTDPSLSCGQTYAYFVKGISAGGGTSTSAAQSVQVTSTATPAAPYLLASFNLNNQVELSINLPQGKVAQKIEIQKSKNGAAFLNLASTSQTAYTDALAKPEPVCYRASFTDPCNNTSPIGNTACPVILKAEQQEDGSVQLNWTPYTGFPGGVQQYTVELLDANGNVINSFAAAGTSYTDRALSNEVQILRYRIKATSTGREVSYSNTEQIEQDLKLFIPSAFTPNGDGLNDVLEIKGKFIDSYTLKVYNSLGSVVFQSTGAATNWDGTYQGKPLPVGAYAYEITVKTEFGTTKRRTGTITLLR
ncbi:T9SS type B sorting domain-containing protein [Pontibacter cellulosilyticus]|uniref:Gliding motility-associated C-terminal domain-containing protein n=1 Tax=Pontibacter cellulosilyticus TaxID=1720253 RepID=A0A923N4K7_9BACT|nr:gliding motility-associated C-terminal domain-containing protein [Pontibacter cellulosilyticus]MBC5992118.1 gliding motility-associated C-terminal domain-containing protein [Pontibacter cellulosilyticus]